MHDERNQVPTPLRYLHDTATSLEKLRISVGNRVKAIERGDDTNNNPIPAIYQSINEAIEQIEQDIDNALAQELKQWPVYNEWLSHVKGIGPSLSSQMLSLLLPPIPEKGPSSWFKAAGLYVQERPDGTRRMPRPRAGEGKITYHAWLRRCLYNVATSFVRNGGYYRAIYDARKARLQGFNLPKETWPDIRVDRAARWATIELFLCHLWDAWCAAEGIHNRGPYGLTTLADGTKVIRITKDGSTVDHAYIERPLPDGKKKI